MGDVRGAAQQPQVTDWSAEAMSIRFNIAKKALFATSAASGTVSLYGLFAPEPVVSKVTAVVAGGISAASFLGGLGAWAGEAIAHTAARTPVGG